MGQLYNHYELRYYPQATSDKMVKEHNDYD